MTIPDYQSLMLPVLNAASDGEVKVSEVIEKLAYELGLSEEERTELLPSGKQAIFSNRAHWAKTYMMKAGLLQSTRRGHFKITERGLKILAKSPPEIDNEYLLAILRIYRVPSGEKISTEEVSFGRRRGRG